MPCRTRQLASQIIIKLTVDSFIQIMHNSILLNKYQSTALSSNLQSGQCMVNGRLGIRFLYTLPN
uniref:Uncharacterized protein n=1 Tax=Anguilla anguilla TaxID=7936 RepID=A0A0E9TYN9_ANGAN